MAKCLVKLDRLPEALDKAQQAAAMAARVLPEGHPIRKKCDEALAEIKMKTRAARHAASSKPTTAPANSDNPGE